MASYLPEHCGLKHNRLSEIVEEHDDIALIIIKIERTRSLVIMFIPVMF